jgi:hypothetical protein
MSGLWTRLSKRARSLGVRLCSVGRTTMHRGFHIHLYSVKWIETLLSGCTIVDCGVDINILSDHVLRDALRLGCYLPLQWHRHLSTERSYVAVSRLKSRNGRNTKQLAATPHWHSEWVAATVCRTQRARMRPTSAQVAAVLVGIVNGSNSIYINIPVCAGYCSDTEDGLGYSMGNVMSYTV